MSNKSGSGASSEEEESTYRIRSTPLLTPEPGSSGPSSINPDEEEMDPEPEPSSEAPASQELGAVAVMPGSSAESARTASDASVNTENQGTRVGYSSRYFWFLYNQKLHSVSGSIDGRPKITIGYSNGHSSGDSDDSIGLRNDTLYVPAYDNSSESHTFESDDDFSEKEKSDNDTEKPSDSTALGVRARRHRRGSSTSEDTSESDSSDTS